MNYGLSYYIFIITCCLTNKIVYEVSKFAKSITCAFWIFIYELQKEKKRQKKPYNRQS